MLKLCAHIFYIYYIVTPIKQSLFIQSNNNFKIRLSFQYFIPLFPQSVSLKIQNTTIYLIGFMSDYICLPIVDKISNLVYNNLDIKIDEPLKL